MFHGIRHALTLVLIGLTVAGCKGPPVPILHDGLDNPRFTRCALRADGNKLYSSAYIDAPSTYPPGSDVQITMYSQQRVDLNINGVPHQMFPSVDEFHGAGIEVFIKKYTVDSLAELGLQDPKAPAAAGQGAPPADPPPAGTDEAAPTERQDAVQAAGSGFLFDKMKPSTAGAVKRGLAAVGMTKEQVLMALGPPIYINFETSALTLPLEEVLKANRWVYYGTWWARTFTFGLASKRAYVFDRDGKLISVES